jgi:formylglycine-generating enzyme required for sulfatase activity
MTYSIKQRPQSIAEFMSLLNESPIKPAKKRSRWWLWLLLLVTAVAGVVVWFVMQPADAPEPIDESSVEASSKSVTNVNKPEPKRTNFTETAYGMSMKMIWVEGGSFEMGSNIGESDERPVHTVTLDGYWIADTEVTQAHWEAVMGTTVRQQREKEVNSLSRCGEGVNYPMCYVNYDEALEFCRRLSNATGRKYTLPTETQWEYAARGGKDAIIYNYSGSNSIGDVAWYDGNSDRSTHPVKGKAPNKLGLYDMSGNVVEWCLDYYRSYSNPSYTGWGPALRGGGCLSGESQCRVACRSCFDRSSRMYDSAEPFGFRVVVIPNLPDVKTGEVYEGATETE